MRSVAAVLTLSLASPAMAQDRCPTGADLHSGVILRDASQDLVLRYHRLPNGGIAEHVVLANGTTSEPLTTPHPLTKVAGSASAPVTLSMDVDGLDRLDQTLRWSSESFISVGGVEIPNGTVTASYIGTAMHEIGDCQYRVWIVDVANASSLGTVYTRNHYAPELGLILKVQRLNNSGTIVSELVFSDAQIARN